MHQSKYQTKQDFLNDQSDIVRRVAKSYVPTGQQVMLFVQSTSDQTEGGIVLPEMSKNVLFEGWAISAGVECKQELEGKYVFYRPYYQTVLNIDGVSIALINENEIILAKNPD